eukprot:5333057-Lingulodinium_polyedra.AAC.1
MAASSRRRHASWWSTPPGRWPARAASHAGHPAVYPWRSRSLRVMYKRRDPRALWKGSAGVTATSGLSRARSTGSGSSAGASRPG